MSITLKYHVKPQELKFESSYTSDHFEKLKKITGGVGSSVTINAYDLVPLETAFIMTEDPFYQEIRDLINKYGDITIVGEW